MSDYFQGKIALVTGASRGIGKAIALRLGKLGATVVGTATSENGVGYIKEEFQQKNINGDAHTLKLNDEDSLKEFSNYLIKKEFLPDVLVNNAGIARDQLFIRMKDSEWDEVMDTNLRGTFQLTKLCVKNMMKNRAGRIINIGSIIGSIGNAGQANYAASKAGLIGLTKSLALELGARNITVNVIAPGFIATDMTSQLSEEIKEKLLAKIPLNDLGAPEDIADAVEFLASEKARYVTGHTLHVNGGMLME